MIDWSAFIESELLLSPGEVARIFRVTPKTINRWRKSGKINAVMITPGGHALYELAEVRRLISSCRVIR